MKWYKDSKTKKKIETLLFAFVCFLVSIICFFRATEGLFIVKDFDSIIVEYQGEFEVSRIHNHRNTSYLFLLNNGDKVIITAEFINKDKFFDFNQKHMFKYSKYVDFRGWHNCLSISSSDGIELLKEKELKDNYRGLIFVYYFFGLMALCCSLFLVALEYADKILKIIKRQQRKKEKRKKDKQKQLNNKKE